MCSLISHYLLVLRTGTSNFVRGNPFFRTELQVSKSLSHLAGSLLMPRLRRIGGHGQLPRRSNCKGPPRATVCSHPPWGRGHGLAPLLEPPVLLGWRRGQRHNGGNARHGRLREHGGFLPGQTPPPVSKAICPVRVSPCALDRLFVFFIWHYDPLFAFSRNLHRIPIRGFRYFRFGKQVAQNLSRNVTRGRSLSLKHISVVSISRRELDPKYRILLIGSYTGPC